jgi:hypothetical protein
MHLPGYIQGGQEASCGYLLLGVYHRKIPGETMPLRWNWDHPTPSPPSEPAPPPGTKGRGGQTRLRVRGGGSHDWKKDLALCLLCALTTRLDLIQCVTLDLPNVSHRPNPDVTGYSLPVHARDRLSKVL